MAKLVKVDGNPFDSEAAPVEDGAKLTKVEGNPFEQPQETGPSFGEFLEPVATFATGAIAEPVAGLAGIVQSLNPFADEGAGAEAVQATREALTYQPKSEFGKKTLGELGGVVEPAEGIIQGAETALGDYVFEKTDSPTLAAAAATLPQAALQGIGFKGGGSAVKVGRSLKAGATTRKVVKALKESAPDSETLRSVAGGLFNEIDDMGVVIKPRAHSVLVSRLERRLKKGGLDIDNTRMTYRALQRLKNLSPEELTLSEIDQVRKVAQSATSKMNNPTEISVGTQMIDEIDSFMDSLDAGKIVKPKGAQVNRIGEKYRAARELWGRAKKSEVITDAFEKAKNQASGFENGIRTQFRQILNNKSRSKFFNAGELDVMREVVRGSKKANIYKLVGRLGFMEGQSTGVLGGSIGAAVGAKLFGPAGMVAVPMVGQVSRKLAQRLTTGGADFADSVVRSGRNGKRIALAYLKNTPKAQRSVDELSQLLLTTEATLDDLPTNIKFLDEVKSITKQRLAEFTGTLAASQASDRTTE